MKTLLPLLLLAACGGTTNLQCPGPFGYYDTQLDSCPDRALADGALDILKRVGLLTFDPATISVSILDESHWQEGQTTVEGYTTQTDTLVSESQGPLLHELIHVHQRPGSDPEHIGWKTNGFGALDNFYYWWALGTDSAIWATIPCQRPPMPAAWRQALVAGGYDLDSWETSVCQ